MHRDLRFSTGLLLNSCQTIYSPVRLGLLEGCDCRAFFFINREEIQ